MYVNGVESTTGAQINTDPFLFDQIGTNTTEFFDGLLGEIKTWAKTFTDGVRTTRENGLMDKWGVDGPAAGIGTAPIRVYDDTQWVTTRWEDQSVVGKDATQTTTVEQPLIGHIHTRAALNFDGSDDSLDMENLAMTNFTVQFAVERDSLQNEVVVSGTNTSFIRIDSGGSITVSIAGTSQAFVVPVLAVDTRYVVTVTRSTTDLVQVFVGSVESSTGGVVIPGAFHASKIGRNTVAEFFDGRLGEIRFWHRQLTGVELTMEISDTETKWSTAYSTSALVFDTVTESSRTIALRHTFAGHTDAVRLYCNDVRVHDLVYNAKTSTWHSMVFVEQGVTCNLEIVDDTNTTIHTIAATQTPRSDPSAVTTSTTYMSPNGVGGGSGTTPGAPALWDLDTVASDTKVVLQGTVASPKYYYLNASNADSNFMRNLNKNNIWVVAEEAGGAIISGELDSTAFAYTQEGSTDVYKLTTGTHNADMGALYYEDSGTIKLLPPIDTGGVVWSDVTALDASPTGGWYISGGEVYVKIPGGGSPDPTKTHYPDAQFTHPANINNCDNVIWEDLIFEFFSSNGSQSTAPLRIRNGSTQILMKNIIFRYNHQQQEVDGCDDVLFDGCELYNDLSLCTYLQSRDSGSVGPGGHLQYSQIAVSFSTNRVTIRNSVFTHGGQSAHLGSSGVNHVEVYGCTFAYHRNPPISMHATSGGDYAFFDNGMNYCTEGWPNVENSGDGGPAYWINNYLINGGYQGYDRNDDAGSFGGGNRYGGSAGDIGQHHCYNNLCSVNQDVLGGMTQYRGWDQASRDIVAGSRFYNNIWQSKVQGAPITSNRVLYACCGGASSTTDALVTDVTWDSNMFHMIGDDAEASDWFELSGHGLYDHAGAVAAMSNNWNPNGMYDNPNLTGTTIGNIAEGTYIAGITNNSVLGTPTIDIGSK